MEGKKYPSIHKGTDLDEPMLKGYTTTGEFREGNTEEAYAPMYWRPHWRRRHHWGPYWGPRWNLHRRYETFSWIIIILMIVLIILMSFSLLRK